MKKIFVVRHPIGTFIFDENRTFKKFAPVDVEEAIKEFEGYEVKINDKDVVKDLRKNIRHYTAGYFKDDNEFNSFLSFSSLRFAKSVVKSSQKRDRLLVQVISSYDDIVKMSNVLSEHLLEWFGVHYPECNLSQEKLINAVFEYGRRDNFPDFQSSIGLDIDDDDVDMLKRYAATLKRITEMKTKMEIYIKNLSSEIMPNFSSLIDPIMASKMLMMAGSLEKLAKMPSSTIQLLGAEKALFRHIRKKKNKPPKYGILYLSSHVQKVPDHLKGKVARIVASKLMVAARLDFYSGLDKSEGLKKQLNAELKRVIKNDSSI